VSVWSDVHGEGPPVALIHAGHLPNLERPDEFDRIVLGFLGKHGV
jgi:hypothetical protein